MQRIILFLIVFCEITESVCVRRGVCWTGSRSLFNFIRHSLRYSSFPPLFVIPSATPLLCPTIKSYVAASASQRNLLALGLARCSPSMLQPPVSGLSGSALAPARLFLYSYGTSGFAAAGAPPSAAAPPSLAPPCTPPLPAPCGAAGPGSHPGLHARLDLGWIASGLALLCRWQRRVGHADEDRVRHRVQPARCNVQVLILASHFAVGANE